MNWLVVSVIIYHTEKTGDSRNSIGDFGPQPVRELIDNISDGREGCIRNHAALIHRSSIAKRDLWYFLIM